MKLSYLQMFRLWEKDGKPGERRLKVWQLYRRHWVCFLTQRDPEDPFDGDSDTIRRVGPTREGAAERCYLRAVEIGIMEEGARDAAE